MDLFDKISQLKPITNAKWVKEVRPLAKLQKRNSYTNASRVLSMTDDGKFVDAETGEVCENYNFDGYTHFILDDIRKQPMKRIHLNVEIAPENVNIAEDAIKTMLKQGYTKEQVAASFSDGVLVSEKYLKDDFKLVNSQPINTQLDAIDALAAEDMSKAPEGKYPIAIALGNGVNRSSEEQMDNILEGFPYTRAELPKSVRAPQ